MKREDLERETIRSLWCTLHRIAATAEAQDGAGGLSMRMLRLAKTIRALEGGLDETTLRLQAMQDFASFAVGKLSEEQVAVFRPIVEQYVNHLRDVCLGKEEPSTDEEAERSYTEGGRWVYGTDDGQAASLPACAGKDELCPPHGLAGENVAGAPASRRRAE